MLAAMLNLRERTRTRASRPLAGWSVVATFLLIGIALIATVWSTRASVVDASDAVRRGQALAIEQAIRADLADLEGPPGDADFETMLRTHANEGLRYVAMVEDKRVVASAGTAVAPADLPEPTRNERYQEVDGRLRLRVRRYRRLRDGGRNWRVIVELEPVQAAELQDASTATLGIGAIAAASLLGVAIVLVLREARRNAEERARERERRLATLGEMSAVLAHEIKNPLASLKGNAQLLVAMVSDDKPKVRAKAERVVDEAVRLESLTNDLLRFVRTGEITREPIDPAALVREAAESIKGEVVIDTTGAPKTWPLDAARIREVIVNLVDNAVAAGPPISVTVKAVNKKLVIEIGDRGPGVPEESRDKIFEAFYTGKTQGTGLGLAVVRRVIEQHNGTITVETNPGGGALFRAEIPEI
jgi:two-component system sensor histidine kinase HydH